MEKAVTTDRRDNKRRNIIIALIIALVIVLSIGGTLAYLTAKTNTKSNVFTNGATSISAVLYETAWDGSTADSGGNPAGDVSTNSNYGVNKAQSMLPGVTVPKDPKITNTNASGGESEYVAMRVTFYKTGSSGSSDTQMTYDEVNALLQHIAIYDGDTMSGAGIEVDSNWIADSGNGTTTNDGVYYFYYNTAVVAQGSTNALFDNVGIPSTIADMSWFSTNCPDGYKIQVDGAAVQASTFSSYTDAQETLKGLFTA